MLYSLVLIISMGIFTDVSGWGSVGHRIVARLALSQLTDKTTEWILPLIPWHWNGSLSAMASWADSIIHENSNPTGFGNWQWSRSLHYINTPDWNCSYLRERDCINDTCIDGAIRNFTKRLVNEFDVKQREEALYFLIHFVGDIHQPLHTGFKDDLGGNKISVRFMNASKTTQLHSMWDSGIIAHRMNTTFSSNENLYYDYIYQIMVNQTSISNNDDNILEWINENIHFICKEIYFDDNNQTLNTSREFKLGEKYYERTYPIIDQRLAYGGRRLAALLNRLEPKPISSKSNKVCVSTYILIIVLSAQFFVGIMLEFVFLIQH